MPRPSRSDLPFAAPLWPLVVLALLIGFMVAVPLWAGARREALRGQREDVLYPARTALLDLRHAFIATVAEARGYLVTRDTLYLEGLRSSLTGVRAASRELEAASIALGPELTASVQRLRGRTEEWLVPVARMVAGEISADTLAVNLESGEQSMTNALDAVEDVDRVLNGIEVEIESRIRSFERTEDILMAALGVAAALIGGSVVWLVLRLNTASQRLAESEVRFRQITENLRESIWIADPDFTTYFYVNPAYESIFGQSIEEALQAPRSFLRAIHPQDRERVASALEGEYAAGDYDATYRVVHPSGTIRWVRARAYPVRDAQGKIFRVAGIAEDITERKEVEEEREKLLERERSALTESQTALQLRDRVLRTVSHDLKDPLHTIAMAADVLEMPLSEEQREKQVAIIRRTVARAHRLVLDLLDAERIRSGRGVIIDPRPMDVRSVLTEVVETFRPQAEQKRQDLICNVDEGAGSVLADRDRIIQAVTNLVSNAVKFTPKGGQVTVRARPEDTDSVQISVADTGPGISEDLLPHLFEPFTQARDTASLGTGLGLAIARGIVEAHGGELEVESEVGKGTIFRFGLPRPRAGGDGTRGDGAPDGVRGDGALDGEHKDGKSRH